MASDDRVVIRSAARSARSYDRSSLPVYDLEHGVKMDTEGDASEPRAFFVKLPDQGKKSSGSPSPPMRGKKSASVSPAQSRRQPGRDRTYAIAPQPYIGAGAMSQSASDACFQYIDRSRGQERDVRRRRALQEITETRNPPSYHDPTARPFFQVISRPRPVSGQQLSSSLEPVFYSVPLYKPISVDPDRLFGQTEQIDLDDKTLGSSEVSNIGTSVTPVIDEGDTVLGKDIDRETNRQTDADPEIFQSDLDLPSEMTEPEPPVIVPKTTEEVQADRKSVV